MVLGLFNKEKDYKNSLINKELITLSCGIGRSYKEATKAVIKAKKNKKKRYYNLVIYSGNRLQSKIHWVFKKKAEDFFVLSKKLDPKYQEILENFCLHDPVTGLLNKTGFVIKLEELKKRGIEQGYYIFFDIDNLHDWNSKIGYAKVDEYLEMIGKEILKRTKHHELYNQEIRAEDIAVHRLNESAGDEFLIFAPAKHNNKNLNYVKSLAERLIRNIYEKQLGIFEE